MKDTAYLLCQPRTSSPQRASVRGERGFSNPRERAVLSFGALALVTALQAVTTFSSIGLPPLRERFCRAVEVQHKNLLDRMMGAPGLAFETWDPSRKCRRTNWESSDFETADFVSLTAVDGCPMFALAYMGR